MLEKNRNQITKNHELNFVELCWEYPDLQISQLVKAKAEDKLLEVEYTVTDIDK